jgi:ligand-binding SRPBCC domain-containing protein
MSLIDTATAINAPIERVFNLARSIDLHVSSSSQSREQAIGGKTHGLIGLGESVEWRAKHFGIWQRMTNKITALSEPDHFHDSMTKGAFKYFEHDHFFTQAGDQTTMRDVIDFKSPLGIVGTVVDSLVLRPYLEKFIVDRASYIKQIAESAQWEEYIVS